MKTEFDSTVGHSYCTHQPKLTVNSPKIQNATVQYCVSFWSLANQSVLDHRARKWSLDSTVLCFFTSLFGLLDSRYLAPRVGAVPAEPNRRSVPPYLVTIQGDTKRIELKALPTLRHVS